jgi:alpha-1,3-glucan synthase
LTSQTLSRLHVCATLAFSQIIGSVCVMVARATAPNRVGPESVFPDAAKWDFQDGLKGSPMASAPFWIALICQIVIVFGYFWFYRKEQLGPCFCCFDARLFLLTYFCSPPMISQTI